MNFIKKRLTNNLTLFYRLPWKPLLSDQVLNLSMQKAKSYENEKNDNVFEAIATVYSKIGSDENNAYFVKSKDNFSNYGYFTYISLYGKFLARCEKPESFESAAKVFMEIAKTSNQYVKDYAKKTYQGSILTLLKEKQEKLKE